jgi:hypothetical protein
MRIQGEVLRKNVRSPAVAAVDSILSNLKGLTSKATAALT